MRLNAIVVPGFVASSTDMATLLSRLSAARAALLDNLTLPSVRKQTGTGQFNLNAGTNPAGSITSGAANAKGAYTQVRGAAGGAVYITELFYGYLASGFTGDEWIKFYIASGGAGSEVDLAIVPTLEHITTNVGAFVFKNIKLDPWIPVAANTRVALAAADQASSMTFYAGLLAVAQSDVTVGP